MRWLATFIVAASPAFAGTIDESKGDAAYLAYGATFGEYVVRVRGADADGVPLSGSGTLISPHWVLTAAHVTRDMTAVEVVTPAGSRAANRVVPHREFRGDNSLHDICLVHLAEPCVSGVYPPLSDGTDRIGGVAAVAGWGMSGSIIDGVREGPFRLRAGTVMLAATKRSVYVCDIRRDALAGPLPYCVAPGDSGGPLFAGGADGVTRLVGVNVYVDRVGSKARYVVGEESGHTRVALYLDWIAEVCGPLDGGCTLPGCQP